MVKYINTVVKYPKHIEYKGLKKFQKHFHVPLVDYDRAHVVVLGTGSKKRRHVVVTNSELGGVPTEACVLIHRSTYVGLI